MLLNIIMFKNTVSISKLKWTEDPEALCELDKSAKDNV